MYERNVHGSLRKASMPEGKGVGNSSTGFSISLLIGNDAGMSERSDVRPICMWEMKFLST